MSGRRISMSDPRGLHLEPAYQIYVEAGPHPRLVAALDDWDLANHAFRKLCAKHREETVCMRQGARVILERKVLMGRFECRRCGQPVFHNALDRKMLAELVCPACGAPSRELVRMS